MIAYGYDDNGLYTGEKQCQKDPIESAKQGKDVWLLPAKSTWEKPLEPKEGYNVKWNGTAWEYEAIPVPPPPPEPTEDEKKEAVRGVRNSYLSWTDFTQIQDAPFTDDEKAKYREYRKYLRDYTNKENWFEQNPATFEEWEVAHYPIY